MQLRSKNLSDKQRRILDFIHDFLQDHGYPPSVREIQGGCAISSTSVVDYNLQILQREGFLRRSPEISRSIELLGPQGSRVPVGAELVPIPVLGYIAAGEPLPVFTESFAAEPMETLDVPPSWLSSSGQVYALRVKGLSMVDALIDDGDVVLLEPVNQVQEGDMVAAWLTEEKAATLKRFYREGNRIRLQPANSQMEPIYVAPEAMEVQGRVVGVIRSLR